MGAIVDLDRIIVASLILLAAWVHAWAVFF
jgi:hypothetical protein